MLIAISRMIISSVLSVQENDSKYPLLVYGCELFLYTVLSTAGLLLMGLILGALTEAIVIIAVFYLCQSNGGGYHADSHLKCFLTMVSGLFCGLMLIKLHAPGIVYQALLLVSVIGLIVLPLHLNQNKRYLTIQTKELRRKSWITTVAIAIMAISCACFKWIYLEYAISVGLFLAALSRLYAFLQEDR